MEQLFSQLTSSPSAKLYKYQAKCADLVIKRKNIILSAPTGAGKTWGALLGFLQSYKEGNQIADRVFYVLPMRTLANSLFASTVDGCSKSFHVVTDIEEKKSRNQLAITIQTGERRTDPFFQGDIIFTTIDQILSNYLNIPLSLPSKLSNINPGALIGSLVIMDEVHLLDPLRSLSTTLEMVERLKPYTQFVFMTATLSSDAIDMMQKSLNAELVILHEEELASIPSHKNKQRKYVWMKEPLSADRVWAEHNGGRSIVICNSVARAQGVYRQLRSIVSTDCKVMLLHSRFLKQDRQNIEAQLTKYFGSEAKVEYSNAILVTTQVVEVGIDISADNLHTELCPANSLIQRAGRVARYPVPRHKGTVWVYDLERTVSGNYRLGPYKGASQAIDRTRSAIRKHSGKVLHFLNEQQLINYVHQNEEKEMLKKISVGMIDIKRDISKIINTSDRSKADERIRSIDAVNVIITDDPENINISKLSELMSIPKVTLKGLLRQVRENDSQNWIAKIPTETETEEINPKLGWKDVKDERDLAYASWLVALSPAVVSYTTEYGLELGAAGLPPEYLEIEAGLWIPYSYKYETFQDHITMILRQSKQDGYRYRIAVEQLERELGLKDNFVNHLVEITCSLHDAGKLLIKWQTAAQDWQKTHYPEYITDKDAPIGHMTFIPATDNYQRIQNGRYSRGSHAPEGAFGVAQELYIYLQEHIEEKSNLNGVYKSLLTAIIRHHSARTHQVEEKVGFISTAVQWLNKALADCSIPLHFKGLITPTAHDRRNFQKLIIDAEIDENWLPLYWILVRRLRLADQKALKCINGGE